MGTVRLSIISNNDSVIYLNVMAIVVLSSLLVLSKRLRSHDTPGDRLFSSMALVSILCAAEFLRRIEVK